MSPLRLRCLTGDPFKVAPHLPHLYARAHTHLRDAAAGGPGHERNVLPEAYRSEEVLHAGLGSHFTLIKAEPNSNGKSRSLDDVTLAQTASLPPLTASDRLHLLRVLSGTHLCHKARARTQARSRSPGKQRRGHSERMFVHRNFQTKSLLFE